MNKGWYCSGLWRSGWSHRIGGNTEGIKMGRSNKLYGKPRNKANAKSIAKRMAELEECE